MVGNGGIEPPWASAKLILMLFFQPCFLLKAQQQITNFLTIAKRYIVKPHPFFRNFFINPKISIPINNPKISIPIIKKFSIAVSNNVSTSLSTSLSTIFSFSFEYRFLYVFEVCKISFFTKFIL